uniref:Polyribonucleotide nucleotidyltransferase n=1 Tax=Anthurium amnicola TaxID=1678845 RepID=A0A1D1Y5A9_9ARAE
MASIPYSIAGSVGHLSGAGRREEGAGEMLALESSQGSGINRKLSAWSGANLRFLCAYSSENQRKGREWFVNRFLGRNYMVFLGVTKNNLHSSKRQMTSSAYHLLKLSLKGLPLESTCP